MAMATRGTHLSAEAVEPGVRKNAGVAGSARRATRTCDLVGDVRHGRLSTNARHTLDPDLVRLESAVDDVFRERGLFRPNATGRQLAFEPCLRTERH
jgi:hypothetical protein